MTGAVGSTLHDAGLGAACQCPACLALAGPTASADLALGTVTTQSASLATPLAPTLANEVTYLSGVNPNGTVAATSFHTWNADTPATYANSSFAAKWGGTTPGTSGGTVFYYFDPASNWTSAEQTAFSSGLAMWSAVANITFTQTFTSGSANVDFIRGASGTGAFENAPRQRTESVGATTLHNQGTGVTIQIDTSTYGWEQLGNFSYAGGYAVQTVLHEEGHLLGLGHAGPYNGTVTSSTQQYSAYDSRLWTIQSYIEPSDTSAAYYSSYAVTGTNWQGNEPTTWMPLDILAAQQLYGAATSGPLSGGQTFGFNSNVGGGISSFFDFTINVNPVITLFDLGTGNTLDLSGYSSAEIVDLNPGTFSSFDGMTNNMAIAFGTAIDNFVGGAGGATVYANADSNVFSFAGSGNTVVLQGLSSDYTLTTQNGSQTVYTRVSSGATYTATNAQAFQFAAACYGEGTRILTLHGERAIETLAEGDLVISALTGEAVPIVWIGHRHVDLTSEQHPARPVRVQAGAFGGGLPHRALLLSPHHAVFMDGVLVPVRCLVNRTTIRLCAEATDISYFHIELGAHDIIRAEGLAAESWLDTGNRAMFANAPVAMLLPDMGPGPEAGSPCAPMVEAGPQLAAIRARLEAVSCALGNEVVAEHAVDLDTTGEILTFLPADVGVLRLRSRSRALAPDRRRLGALVASIEIADQMLKLDGADMAGFYDTEDHGKGKVRWTDGDAVIAVEAVHYDRVVSILVARLADDLVQVA
jgi:serralysin